MSTIPSSSTSDARKSGASTSTGKLPVIVISGLGAPRAAADVYGRIFRSRGHRTFTSPQRLLGYGDVRVAAGLVAEEVQRVKAETGASKVHLVGMSLGGLTGLYYLKCMGGARHVERFVSVGGPLNGSTLSRLAGLIPWRVAHAMAQTTPDNPLMRELRAAPAPASVAMYSVGTMGDILTPRRCWDVEGLQPVETRHGFFPVGHWMLFVHPGNHRAVAQLLE